MAITIPLLSAFGRPLQHWVFETFGETAAAWIIGLLLAGLAAAVVFWLTTTPLRRRPYLLLAWGATLTAALVAIIFFLPQTEERLHFVTFGIFGFLSRILIPSGADVVVVLAAAGGDELFQAWLPDRVGDWRDVGMNVLAGALGMLAAVAGRR